MRAARDDRDRHAGPRERAGEESADRTGSYYCYTHVTRF
jgi:hypothetical protein